MQKWRLFNTQHSWSVASPGFGAMAEGHMQKSRQLSTYSRCQTLYRSEYTKNNCCKSRGDTFPIAPYLATPMQLVAAFAPNSSSPLLGRPCIMHRRSSKGDNERQTRHSFRYTYHHETIIVLIPISFTGISCLQIIPRYSDFRGCHFEFSLQGWGYGTS